MHTSLVVGACLSLASICLAEPGVVSMRTYRNPEKHALALRKRASSSFPVTLVNYPYIGGGFYFVNATVGTPPQSVQLDIDTGSSDVWMFGVGSCDATTSYCAGGAFDESASTSLTLLSQGTFEIQYFTAGSGVTGDYVGDDFTIGGTTIKNLTMGVASKAVSTNTGIMGIGFDLNEAIVGEEVAQGDTNAQPYPNLIDEMVKQGLIGVRGYSLYLDDIEANTGNIVFGGIDKAKFSGDLGILEIQPDASSGTYSSFGVILNSVGVTDNTGSTILTTSNMPNVVVLDTGTAFTILPADLVNELFAYFGAVNDETYGPIVLCDLGGLTGSLNYQFAGPTGPLISVPFEELAVPIVDPSTGEVLEDEKNRPVCQLGISAPSSSDEPLLFGDTFLRSAYVVYDLDNLQIGIAQTLFNVTDSNVVAITASATGQNLPGKVASVATTIAQTKTQGVAGGETASFITGTPVAVQTSLGGAQGASALSGVKTTYSNGPSTPAAGTKTGTGTGSSSTSTKKSGAATLTAMSGALGLSILVAVFML